MNIPEGIPPVRNIPSVPSIFINNIPGVPNVSRCLALYTNNDNLIWKPASISGVGSGGYYVHWDDNPDEAYWIPGNYMAPAKGILEE